MYATVKDCVRAVKQREIGLRAKTKHLRVMASICRC